jgi:Fic family protein
MEYSDKLKIIQKLSEMTQEKLAQKIGISFAALNALINGRSRPHKKTQEKIDELYLRYSGEKKIPDNVLVAKKNILVKKSKKNKNLLRRIINNSDIYKQLILKLTYHTNRIEGSSLTEAETGAILFENAVLANKSITEQLEAKNHQTAIEYLFNYLVKKGKIDQELILKLHSILLNSIDLDAGFYRRHGVRIVGTNIITANYLKIPKLIDDLIKDINKKEIDIMAKVARTHSNFEQIHPFGDGNGRIGRLIIQAVLLKHNYAPAIIEQENRIFYLKYLNIAQTKEDFFLFEDFICDAVIKGYEIIERKK